MTSVASLLEGLNVSRETLDRLESFAALLKKWNPKINLVSRDSLAQLWTRHIVDSIQLFRCVEPAGHWVDLGSGGGFPGLIIAILAMDEAPDVHVTLIESDQRKAVFLRAAARETGANCTILTRRIEDAAPQAADILSARALADLVTLLRFAERHMKPDGVALFPKGATWKKECAEARQRWNFACQPVTSRTNPEAVILKIEGVSRA